MKSLVTLLCAALGLLPFTLRAEEQLIYKWTDSAGVIHYSGDKPDRADLSSLEVLRVVEVRPAEALAGPPGSPPPYAEALAVAQRLQADRLARAQARLQQEALRLRERQARLDELQTERQAQPAGVSYLVPYYPVRRYPPPVYRWRPGDKGFNQPPPWVSGDRNAPWRHPPPLTSRTQQAR